MCFCQRGTSKRLSWKKSSVQSRTISEPYQAVYASAARAALEDSGAHGPHQANSTSAIGAHSAEQKRCDLPHRRSIQLDSNDTACPVASLVKPGTFLLPHCSDQKLLQSLNQHNYICCPQFGRTAWKQYKLAQLSAVCTHEAFIALLKLWTLLFVAITIRRKRRRRRTTFVLYASNTGLTALYKHRHKERYVH